MEANTMVGHRLGQFYEGFSSWRRALARAAPESQPGVFANCVSEVADWISKGLGLDKIDAVDELVDMAASIGWDDVDAVQKILSDALKVRSERPTIDQYPSDDDDDPPGALLERLAGDSPSPLDDDVVVPLYPEPTTNKRKRRGNGAAREHQTIAELQSEAAFAASLRPPEYLLHGVLQRRFIYSLTGTTNSGKTAVSFHIAICVALGRPIGDLAVKQGNVLMLVGENPDDARYRWVAMRQQMDVGDEAALPVWWETDRVKLSTCFASLTEAARAIGGFSLVVVDTSAAYYEGDEVNDNVAMGDHARMLRGLTELPGGPCVLVNAHPKKRAGEDDLVPLGAGAFLNEVDGNLTVVKEGSSVKLHWLGKFRGPEFSPISFELKTVTHERLVDSDGNPFPTVVARHLSDAAADAIDAARKNDADLVLAQIEADPKASQRDYASRLQWNLATGKPHFTRVNRAIARLKTAKLVTLELDGLALTDKGSKRLKNRGSYARLKNADPVE